MSDLVTRKIPRNVIEQITKDNRAIRYLENIGEDVNANLPGLIDAVSQQAYAAEVRSSEAYSLAADAMDEAESASGQLSEIVAQVARLQKSAGDEFISLVYSLAAQVANMKPKRITPYTITISGGSATGTQTLPNPVDLNSTEIVWQGSSTTATVIDSGSCSLRLTSSTVVTAERSGTTGQVVVRFSVKEY